MASIFGTIPRQSNDNAIDQKNLKEGKEKIYSLGIIICYAVFLKWLIENKMTPKTVLKTIFRAYIQSM